MAQSVEHILGKDEVTSSILVTSSKVDARSQETVDGHFGFYETIERFSGISIFSRIVLVFLPDVCYTIEKSILIII